MSKAYVLTATYCEDSFTEGVFSSYTAMLTYLREKYDYTSEVTSLSDSECGVFVEQTILGYGVTQWDLSYVVHNLIGETSHKTGKLVIKGRQSAMLSLRQRGYAIFKSLYFGILPSWFYEKHCHYSDNGEGMNIKTYLQHLWLNLIIVKCLVLKTEHECTHDFHKMRVNKWFRWQYKD